MSDRTYCYGNDVLKNLEGIKDQEKLDEYERRVTSMRINMLIDSPVEGHFDFEHLKAIHRYIF